MNSYQSSHYSTQDLEDLKQLLADLIVDLGTIFQRIEEKEDLIVIETFYNRLHHNTILDHTERRLMPYKEHIEKRSIDFFDKNRFMFSGLPDDRIAYYRNEIIDKNRLTQSDKDMIWNYLDSIVALVESYHNRNKKKKTTKLSYESSDVSLKGDKFNKSKK